MALLDRYTDRVKLYVFLFLFLYMVSAKAHPVIYEDGWVYWASFTSQSNKQRLSYTVHPRFAIEVNTESFLKLRPYRDYKVGLNTLIKRWYMKDSQGNVYFSFHGGMYQDHSSQETGYILHPEIELDWESRKLYTALSVSANYFEHLNPMYRMMYRVGMAPYVAGMKELQTWFILQLDTVYFSENENLESVTLTPLFRFFYKNVLWEVGADLNGSFFITLMLHH